MNLIYETFPTVLLRRNSSTIICQVFESNDSSLYEETERFCHNGEEIGDKYTCTYGCPVNSQGYGICSKTMMMLYPIMEAVRSGGDLENIGGDGKYSKVIVCPDGCVMFRITAKPLGNQNPFKGKCFD